MSSAQIFRRNIALQNLLQATEIRPAELQAIKSTSLALSLSSALEAVASHTPIEPTVKLILKSRIDKDLEKFRRYATLHKLVGLSGSARSGADVEGLVERNAAANQEKVHQAVAEAFKFVTYSPNKPTETADPLGKTSYANFPRSDQ